MYLLKGRKYELLLKVWCSGYCDYIAQSFVLKRISQCSTTAGMYDFLNVCLYVDLKSKTQY